MTSFCCFKYMSLYSAIQFTSVSFLYAKASNLGDFQFLFIDLLLILPIAVFMGWAGPAPSLGPKRPTADLVSRKVLTPLLGVMAICILTQAVAYIAVREQPWYVPPKVNHEKSNIKSSENTALFLISCFEYIFSGIVLNAGPPFRQGTTQNCEYPAGNFLFFSSQISRQIMYYGQAITDSFHRAACRHDYAGIAGHDVDGPGASTLAEKPYGLNEDELGL